MDLPNLSADYLRGHIDADDTRANLHKPNPGDDCDFGKRVYEAILEAAAQQLGNDESPEMTIQVPVTLRAHDTEAAGEGVHPLGGCVEVCVGVIVQVCYHRNYKGDHPGKGVSSSAS